MRAAAAMTGLLLTVTPMTGCDRPAAGPTSASTPAAPPPSPPSLPSPAGLAAETQIDEPLMPVLAMIGRHRTTEARADLLRHLAAHPDDGHAEFLLGLTYHREKRYALARPHFERAIGLAPAFQGTWHFLGWCCYYLGDVSCARQAFEGHLLLMPDEGDSVFGLGLIAIEADDLEGAERHLRRSIELQADEPGRAREVAKAHARLGDVYVRLEDLPRARAELERAVELWPQHYTAFFKLSRVLTRLGDEEAADRAYRMYLHYQAQAEPPRGVPEPPS